MTLGEIVKEYRQKYDISQRKFAEISGLSNSYISQLEQNMNSKNGLPIKPSLEAIKQVADAMGVSLDDVLRRMDDIMIDISGESSAEDDSSLNNQIMNLVSQLPDNLKMNLLEILRATVAGARTK